jgi:hypothetical protein
MDVETHLHFDIAQKARVSLKSFVIFPHNSNLISNIGKSNAQKSVEQLKNFAEL